MALIYNLPERDLDVRGTITTATGAVINLSPANIVSYRINESSASSGFALGEAQSATYSIEIDNSAHDLSTIELSGAKVVMKSGIYRDGSIKYDPFGVWYITSPRLSDQSAVAILDGSDALELSFNDVFADAKGNYPRTIGSLLAYVCSLAGIELKNSAFLNSNVSIAAMPAWPEGTTLRGVVAYIAATAGGFARIARDGTLEIVSYGASESVGTITADTYRTIESGDGARFSFNCLAVKYLKTDKYQRYAISDKVDSASNTLQIDSNPLYTVAIAQAVKSALTGFKSDGLYVDWIGDPTLRLGDAVTVEGISDSSYTVVVNRQSISYDGGLSASTESALATEAGASSGYVANEPAINAAGMVNGSKIVARSVTADKIAAGSITAEEIAAGSVTADKIQAGAITADKIQSESITTEKLAAGSVTADRIAAGSITTEKLSAGAVNAEKIEAGAITAEKIAAGAIDADAISAITGAFDTITVNNDLYAAYAHVLQLAAQNIAAGNIETDRLAAVLAEIVTLQAKTGDFDLATVKNLLSNALILKEGQANSMMITNLAVTSANLLSATIGELVLKGSDGGFYRVYVGADGIIHTEAVNVSLGEIEAGQTIAGNQIVETTANIRYLNAQSIKGQTAIIDEIITTALTAGKITATEALIASATIPSLYTTSIQAIGNSLDLSANESIRLIVDQKNATYYRDSEPENAVAGDVWIDSTTFKNYVAEGMTGRNLPQFDAGNGDLLYKFNEDADEFEFYIDENGNLMASWAGVEIRNDACLYTQNTWREVITSELRNSFIEIMRDSILIKSGGNIHIGAGGKLDVESGSAHFKTSDYSLSIMAGDGSEDTVLDFDAESKTLRVDEVNALNIRPYVAGTVTVLASDIGGVDGLANMLSASRYEHVVYRPDYDEVSTEPIVIKGCDSALVEIIAGSKTRIPPIVFSGVNANVLIENVEWNNLSGNALEADSGNICIKNSIINAMNGVIASKHARVAWIGNTALSTAGSCTADAFRAIDCATIRLNGMIPTGNLAKATGGVIESVDVTNGTVVEPEVPEFEEVTTTLTAAYGYYGTASYWNAGELFQGYTNAKGQIYGCMKFTLPSDAESIVSATLTLKAASSIGTGALVNVRVYGSATAYGNRPTLGTRYINKSSAVAAGQSCSLSATTAATALLNGTAKQLVLYTDETSVMSGKAYSKHYAKFTSAKLKITYRRKKA